MTLAITQQLLPSTQYITAKTKKKQIVLHLTVGSYRPDYVVQGWAADPTRVGTTYIIGGMASNGDKAWDGKIIQAVPLECSIYHLGLKGELSNNGLHDKTSVGIELCNWGGLAKTASGEFMTYVSRPLPLSQVCDLGRVFRNNRYYHAITDAQIASLKSLILHICEQTGIVLPKGKVFDWADVEYNPQRAMNEVITFHSSYRSEKSDMPLFPNLAKMLNELCA
jgi:N-acetyl-anhydromuramyl-L-alanine amidase AmpD